MSATAPAMQEIPALDLAGLRKMDFKQLDELYRAGKRPASIADLNGDAKGAMLAWRSPARGPVAWLLRAWGTSWLFPWEGKSFKSQSAELGEGINRVNLFKKMRWFPFKTRFEASFLDGKPSFLLDYSGPGNPPLKKLMSLCLRVVRITRPITPKLI